MRGILDGSLDGTRATAAKPRGFSRARTIFSMICNNCFIFCVSLLPNEHNLFRLPLHRSVYIFLSSFHSFSFICKKIVLMSN